MHWTAWTPLRFMGWSIPAILIFIHPCDVLAQQKAATEKTSGPSAPTLSKSHQHLIFSGIRPDSSDANSVYAGVLIDNQVPGHGPNYLRITRSPERFDKISLAQHLFELGLGQSVFKATAGTGTSVGTAFLISKDLVLTNQHVLASFSSCRQFAVQLNHRAESVACKKVEYCSGPQDYCIVRMNPMANGQAIGDEVPALKLADQIVSSHDALLFSIGDAKGLGIQAASYPSAGYSMGTLYHCIRDFEGNSGSPILDTSGRVVGVHHGRMISYSENKKAGVSCPTDREAGMAAPSASILDTLKREKPALYQEIKNSTGLADFLSLTMLELEKLHSAASRAATTLPSQRPERLTKNQVRLDQVQVELPQVTLPPYHDESLDGLADLLNSPAPGPKPVPKDSTAGRPI